MNILDKEDYVKGAPDEALIQLAQMPTEEIPQFLVVSEIQRREKMRADYAAKQQTPQGTVTDQVIQQGIASLNPNPEAIQLLSNYPEKIKWKSLSKNYKALDLLNNNIDKIKWKYLSENPNAENLIKNNLDKIDWNKLSSNPVIFEIDYDFIKKNLAVFNEDLMKKCYHPDRLKYYLNKFNYDIGDDSYVDNLCLDDS